MLERVIEGVTEMTTRTLTPRQLDELRKESRTSRDSDQPQGSEPDRASLGESYNGKL